MNAMHQGIATHQKLAASQLIGLWVCLALLLMLPASASPLTAAATVAPSPAAHFPSLRAENLSGRSFNLPADFASERNLIFIAFQREQQSHVDTWLSEVKHFQALDPKLEYYEMPTPGPVNSVARWFMTGGMRRGITSLDQRNRTIILFLDKKPLLDSLHITDESRIYVLVVNRQGNILWRTSGDYSEDKDKATSLHNFLMRP